MLIDWFTVGAQAVNFLVLAWLLKRFLYRPILDAVDAREKRIATELADADAKKAEALKERDDFGKKNAEFDQQRASLLAKATTEATSERDRLLQEARKAADALSAKRQEALRSEAGQLNQVLARHARDEVFAIARKALSDLASTSLEERLAEIFVRRLRAMDAASKAAFGKVLGNAAGPALVRSAFDLPAAQRAEIQKSLNEAFSAEIGIRFETAPDLVGGIELGANGQKLGWNISEYLVSLQAGVDHLLQGQKKADAKARPNADPGPAIR
ncbi:MAG: F0F1 ATP synthase subunit delta [Betaproteobacteria bacterium]